MLASVWHADGVEDLARPLLNSWSKLEKWGMARRPVVSSLCRVAGFVVLFYYVRGRCPLLHFKGRTLRPRSSNWAQTCGAQTVPVHDLVGVDLNLLFVGCQAALIHHLGSWSLVGAVRFRLGSGVLAQNADESRALEPVFGCKQRSWVHAEQEVHGG